MMTNNLLSQSPILKGGLFSRVTTEGRWNDTNGVLMWTERLGYIYIDSALYPYIAELAEYDLEGFYKWLTENPQSWNLAPGQPTPPPIDENDDDEENDDDSDEEDDTDSSTTDDGDDTTATPIGIFGDIWDKLQESWRKFIEGFSMPGDVLEGVQSYLPIALLAIAFLTRWGRRNRQILIMAFMALGGLKFIQGMLPQGDNNTNPGDFVSYKPNLLVQAFSNRNLRGFN